MKLVFLFCFVAYCSGAKVSPFVPEDIIKHHVDTARVNFFREKNAEKEAMSAEQVESVENIAPKISENANDPDPTPEPGHISLSSFSFSYCSIFRGQVWCDPHCGGVCLGWLDCGGPGILLCSQDKEG